VLAEPIKPDEAAHGSRGWRRRLHFDFHVLQVLLQRGWGIVAGFVTVLLVPLVLGSVEQGYYYTFASLLALQVFFELGFNVVVTQLVGHEAARLQIDENGRVSGDAVSAARMGSLLRLLWRWYLVAALLFASIVSSAGFFFFERQGSLPAREWAGAWLLLVVLTAVNLFFSPRLAVLEGIGRVGQVARMRLLQSIVGFVLMWLAFLLGAGLWAVPFVSGTAAAGTALWLARFGRLHLPAAATTTSAIRWRVDVFPLQWRIALSWTSGWFVFYAFTPMLFAFQGEVEAGKVGLALSIFGAVSTLGMSWANASAPKMVRHVALGERRQLNQLFRATAINSVAFVFLVSMIVLGVIGTVGYFAPTLAARVAPLPVLACLALVAIVNTFVFTAAVYLRAHKEEPLLLASIVGGLLTGLSAFAGARAGALPMMMMYAALTCGLGLPWTIVIFRRYYRRHA
jgi:O-antigen/teichoic acid export membrane protein